MDRCGAALRVRVLYCTSSATVPVAALRLLAVQYGTRSAFVPYAACDLEIAYRNAAGIIPKECLVQREIQRITPEIRLFRVSQQRCSPQPLP